MYFLMLSTTPSAPNSTACMTPVFLNPYAKLSANWATAEILCFFLLRRLPGLSYPRGNTTGAQTPAKPPPISLLIGPYRFLNYQPWSSSPDCVEDCPRHHYVSDLWTEEFARMPHLIDIYEHETSGKPDYQVAAAHAGMDNHTRSFPAKIDEVLESILYNGAAIRRSYNLCGLFECAGFSRLRYQSRQWHIYCSSQ